VLDWSKVVITGSIPGIGHHDNTLVISLDNAMLDANGSIRAKQDLDSLYQGAAINQERHDN